MRVTLVAPTEVSLEGVVDERLECPRGRFDRFRPPEPRRAAGFRKLVELAHHVQRKRIYCRLMIQCQLCNTPCRVMASTWYQLQGYRMSGVDMRANTDYIAHLCSASTVIRMPRA